MGHVGQQHLARGQWALHRIGGAVIRAPHHEQDAVGPQIQATPRRIGGIDAGPRLQQGHVGIPQRIGHRKHIASTVAIQHIRPQRYVLCQPAGNQHAKTGAPPLVEHVRLQAQALATFVAVLPALAHLHDRQRHLVPQPCRLLVEVTAVKERIAIAQADHLGIRRAQAYGIHANQNFIGAAGGQRLLHRRTVNTQIGQPRTAQRPTPVAHRQRFLRSPVLRPILRPVLARSSGRHHDPAVWRDRLPGDEASCVRDQKFGQPG